MRIQTRSILQGFTLYDGGRFGLGLAKRGGLQGRVGEAIAWCRSCTGKLRWLPDKHGTTSFAGGTTNAKRFPLRRFVGLQSEWFLSMCLSTYLQTGLRQVTEVQLEKIAPPVAALSRLYTEVAARFWRDVERLNISTAPCATL